MSICRNCVILARDATKRKNHILLEELELLIQSPDVKGRALYRIRELREEEKKFSGK